MKRSEFQKPHKRVLYIITKGTMPHTKSHFSWHFVRILCRTVIDMSRADFQCLILPFITENNSTKFAIFKRADMKIWQFISGGGEDSESPSETAKRESFEEAGISQNTAFYKLDTVSSIPAEIFSEKYRKNWGKHCFVVREYAFACRLTDDTLQISDEHTDYQWVSYDEAMAMLKYDSNKTALTELRARIQEDIFVEAD